MESLKIIETKIEKVDYINDIVLHGSEGSSIEIHLGTKISSTVNYNEDVKRCKCVSTVKIEPQNMDVNFSAIISVAGVFDYGDMDERKEIHVGVCKKLFPYLQTATISFMNMVGIPNFILEEPMLEVEAVQIENK